VAFRRASRFVPLLALTAVGLLIATAAVAGPAPALRRGGGRLPARIVRTAGQCGDWTHVPTPPARKHPNRFGAIAAISPSDIWAVGGQEDEVGFSQFTLAEHWDGKAWHRVRTVSPHKYSTDANFFNGVSGTASDDVWAVGVHVVNGGTSIGTLIEHWNGKRWRVVQDPTGSLLSPSLTAVAAIARDDVWAVGSSRSSENGEGITLTEHWDGTMWKVVHSPNPEGSEDDILFGVSSAGPNDVWAVGTGNQGLQTLVEHFNGTRWKIVHSPSREGFSNRLMGVTAIGPDDVWAAGAGGAGGVTLFEHWNGASWRIVDSPSPPGFTQLRAVDASTADDVWAVGTASDQDQHTAAVAEHWDGSSWTIVAPPHLSDGDGLNGVAALAGEQWAVGETQDQSGAPTTLIEHRCDP
jgi:hypothetical protein